MTGPSASVRDLAFDAGPAGRRERIVQIDALDLAPGQLVALSGPSGSGKSTLLYLLSGLLVPTAGSVRWGEVDLGRQGEMARDRWRRRHAGFVFQNFNLIEELPPIDNVLVPVWFSTLSARKHRDRAAALLDRFGVPAARARTNLLSRGEQQRVALARALIYDPPIMFADEPTASLDTASAAVVARELADLAHREGRLVIAASHDPTVLTLADSHVRLNHGRMVGEAAA